MKKGFTLIELLAVIVILAIIALIATPIILGIINNTKEEANIRSVQNYLDAVELSIAATTMDDSTSQIDGTYEIIDNGKKIQKGEEPVIEVSYDGEGLEEGTLIVKDGKIKTLRKGKIGDKYVVTFNGELKELNYEPEDEILITGENFNKAIKKLVSGEEKAYTDIDTIVKSIEFLSYGMLPEGYTLNDLEKMTEEDVSLNSDNKIMAYYDGKGKVFIYSKGLIDFNENSKSMFSNFQSMNTLLFGEINTSIVGSMKQLFYNCINLKEINLSNFETSSVDNMNLMFYQCKSLTKLDLSSFDTRNVSNMNSMFSGCSNLNKIDLSNFNTSGVTDMKMMFYGCSSLIELDLSSFDTLKVEDMSQMFHECTDLTKIIVDNFDTKNTKYLNSMFNGCNSLIELDLSSFNTSSAINISYMFRSTTDLQNLNISNFTFNDSIKTNEMFAGAKSDMNIIVGGEAQKALVKSLFSSANVTIK